MKHVIVTGGSRGIGLAAVRALLDAGYFVSTCSRSTSHSVAEIENNPASSSKFFYAPLNMEHIDEYENFVENCMKRGGPLFALVNNAGIASAGALATFSDLDSERILRVNVLGPMAMARVAIGYFLKDRQGGRIVNISSITGTRGYTGLAAYSASKAGLDGLTRTLARELGGIQVTVNSIAPGYVRTDMSAGLTAGQMDKIIRRTPLGRLAEVSDVVGLLKFLLSEDAGFITGQVIRIDGGMSC